jgi:hypothetical protein
MTLDEKIIYLEKCLIVFKPENKEMKLMLDIIKDIRSLIK